MMVIQIQEQHFLQRLETSGNNTETLIKIAIEKEGIKSVRPPTKEEDKNLGIDCYFNDIPVQCKTRHNYPDIPICVAQPMYGWDSPNTVVGRDLRCLQDGHAKLHYVGIMKDDEFTNVYRCKSEDIAKITKDVLNAWETTETETYRNIFNRNWFTASMIQKWLEKGVRNKCVFSHNSCEVWYKKNVNEKFCKINLYVPASLVNAKDLLKH